jgi:hypothetical protein
MRQYGKERTVYEVITFKMASKSWSRLSFATTVGLRYAFGTLHGRCMVPQLHRDPIGNTIGTKNRPEHLPSKSLTKIGIKARQKSVPIIGHNTLFRSGSGTKSW